jgi:hypothetical protein
MNASTPTHRSFRLSAMSQPAFTRAAWKEYRMLRGFWLGVATLGVMQMLATAWLLAPASRPAWMFASAWGSAALYAVGAAVTLFSVEREEQTDRFLKLLPPHNGALLAGKLAAAQVTALALVLVLSVVGAGISSGWPRATEMGSIAGMGTVFLIEALVWSVLASLLCRNPLLAAIAAIAAASIGAQLAIFATAQTAHGFSLNEYRDAIPARLLIVVAVGALDMWLGLRWLRTPRSRAERRTPRSEPTADAIAVATSAATASAAAAQSAPITHGRLFARLVWQSWREGWAAMLLALPIGLFLMASDVLIAWLITASTQSRVPWIPMSLMVLPALYGALVFRADQRGRQYRFLADRAAPPRLVWAARQAAWLAPLLALGVVVQVAAWTGLGISFFGDLIKSLHGERGRYGSLNSLSPEIFSMHLERVSSLVLSNSLLAWCALSAAYACGQFASMAIRSNVLAGFVALAASVVITLWGYVLAAWELSSLWFVLPIALGAFIASLLYARSWLTERRGLIKWLPPVAAIAAPLGLIALLLPAMRMAQIERPEIHYRFLRQPLVVTINKWELEEPAARATALRYELIAADMDTRRRRSRGTPTDSAGARAGEGAYDPRPSDAYGRPPSLWETVDPQAKDTEESITLRVDRAQQRRDYLVENQENFEELATLSKERQCRFAWGEAGMEQWNKMSLLLHDVLSDAARLIDEGDLDRALTRLTTWRRTSAHMAQFQENDRVQFLRDLTSRDVGTVSVQWAQAPGQTRELLHRAIDEMWEAENQFPNATEPFVAEFLAMRDVVLGNAPPTFMRDTGSRARKPQWHEQLAFFANELPWERRRALVALQKLAEARLDYADAVSHCLIPANQSGVVSGADDLKRLLDPGDMNRSGASDAALALLSDFYGWRELADQLEVLQSCRTSYLVGLEMLEASDIDLEMRRLLQRKAARLAELHRLALIAYRFDHGEYPDSLRELVPNYLPALLTDPFTCEIFEYRREGFELPILLSSSRVSSRTIPPHTPILWSPGANYSEPEERTAYVGKNQRLVYWHDLTKEESTQPREQPVIDFSPTTSAYWVGSPIVLPLPPIDAIEDVPSNSND